MLTPANVGPSPIRSSPLFIRPAELFESLNLGPKYRVKPEPEQCLTYPRRRNSFSPIDRHGSSGRLARKNILANRMSSSALRPGEGFPVGNVDTENDNAKVGFYDLLRARISRKRANVEMLQEAEFKAHYHKRSNS